MMMLKRFFFLSGMVEIILENLTCSERKLSLFGERFGLSDYFRDITNHVKRDFGEMIVFSGADGVEAGDGVLERDQFTQVTGKHLSDLERLRQKPLHLSGSCDGQFIFFRQLIHTQNGDDVLQ